MVSQSWVARRIPSAVSNGSTVSGSCCRDWLSCHSCTAHAVLRTLSTASRNSLRMRGSKGPERISYSSLTRSAQVFFNWRFVPQKVSLGTKSSTATPNKRPSLLRRTPTTRACEVSCEARFVNSISVPTAGGSEEHTPELQSHLKIACRLLLYKKKKKTTRATNH